MRKGVLGLEVVCVCVCDLGSQYGTFVNGEVLGGDGGLARGSWGGWHDTMTGNDAISINSST